MDEWSLLTWNILQDQGYDTAKRRGELARKASSLSDKAASDAVPKVGVQSFIQVSVWLSFVCVCVCVCMCVCVCVPRQCVNHFEVLLISTHFILFCLLWTNIQMDPTDSRTLLEMWFHILRDNLLRKTFSRNIEDFISYLFVFFFSVFRYIVSVFLRLCVYI